jgi:hypothetical protein
MAEEGFMWMLESMEGGEVAWVDMLWLVEGLLKWDFSTPIAITGLEEEEPPIVVLEETIANKYIAWKGLSGFYIKDFNDLKTLNCQTRVSELRAATLYVRVRF